MLEWVWTRIFGDGEAGLRSLPALAGVLTVPVSYGIGRRLAGVGAGLAVAILVAVNPLLVWFSQEARSYALVVLLGSAALLLLLHCLEDDRPRLLAAWALVAILALASHYFAAFVLAPQAAWLLWQHPRRRAAVAAVGALAAAGAALLPLLIAQSQNPYDIAGDSLAVRVVQVPKQLLLGYRGPSSLLLGLLGAVLAGGGVWLLARRTEPAVQRRALLLAAVGLCGVVLPLLAALAGKDYLNARNAIPALVPLLAVLGTAYAASKPRVVGRSLLGILCALSLTIVVAVASDSSYQRADWAGLADALGSSGSDRAVVVTPANGALALRYYRPGLTVMDGAGANVGEVDVITVAGSGGPGETPELPAQFGTSLAVAGFGAPQQVRTSTYAILRFPAAGGPVHVTPDPLGALRFGERLPAVATLAGGR